MDKNLNALNHTPLNAKPILANFNFGFSLIETLVALVIFAIIFLTIADFITTSFKYNALQQQQQIALRYSQSLLTEVRASANPSLYAGYSGNCKDASSNKIASWCQSFIYNTELTKEVIFHNLNVKTNYSPLTNSYNLKAFKLQIQWQNLAKDTQFQKLTRVIYILDK